MRIAWIDLTFTWPPRGGAGMDCYEILSRLAEHHDVCLIAPSFSLGFKRFRCEGTLPFPVKTVPFEAWNYTVARVKASFRGVVDAFRPDVVIVGDAWSMKPHLINAMSGYRIVSRYYAYESLCLLRNGQLFRHGRLCENHLLKNAHLCRACAWKWVITSLLGGRREELAKIHEFVLSGASLPSYLPELRKSLDASDIIIVYNTILLGILQPWGKNVVIRPSGPGFPISPDYLRRYADPEENPFRQLREPGKRVILVPGRLDDPAKGGDFARAVGRVLGRSRSDVLMVFTGRGSNPQPWERFLGWLPRERMPFLYAAADLVFIPSLWPEPHGIVAIEALALGRKVVATRVGGVEKILQRVGQQSLVTPGDVKDACLRLEEALSDRSFQGPDPATIEEAWGWDTITAELVRDLKSIAGCEDRAFPSRWRGETASNPRA